MAAYTNFKCTLVIPPTSGEDESRAIPPNFDNQDIFIYLTEHGIKFSFPLAANGVVQLPGPDPRYPPTQRHVVIPITKALRCNLDPLIDWEAQSLQLSATGQEVTDVQVVTFEFPDDYLTGTYIIYGHGPFSAYANATIDGWLNHDAPICGVATWDEIVSSTTFTLLVHAPYVQFREYLEYFFDHESEESIGDMDIDTQDPAKLARDAHIRAFLSGNALFESRKKQFDDDMTNDNLDIELTELAIDTFESAVEAFERDIDLFHTKMEEFQAPESAP